MTAQLVLPETHHVTDGEWLTAGLDGDGCPYELPTLRVWWWPVDGEWEQNDSVGLHGTDEFGPPADLVKLAEPCDTCPIDQRGWVLVRDLPSGRTRWEHCPDCYRGKRIVQLVQTCTECGGDGIDGSHDAALYYAYSGEISNCSTCEERQDGALPVARVTITLLPSYLKPSDSPTVDNWCTLVGYTDDGSSVVMFALPGRDKSQRPDVIVLPFKVEPGKTSVVRAVEVTGTD